MLRGKGRGCILSYHRPVSDIVRKRKRVPSLSFPFLTKWVLGSTSTPLSSIMQYVFVYINIAEREDFKSWLCNVSNIKEMDGSDINCSSINSTCSL